MIQRVGNVTTLLYTMFGKGINMITTKILDKHVLELDQMEAKEILESLIFLKDKLENRLDKPRFMKTKNQCELTFLLTRIDKLQELIYNVALQTNNVNDRLVKEVKNEYEKRLDFEKHEEIDDEYEIYEYVASDPELSNNNSEEQ